MITQATVPAPSPQPPANTQLARQEPLALTIPKGVAIIGVGGVGSWIAWFLALAGVKNLWLFDPDAVSETNLNRLPVPTTALNTPKTRALADALKLFRPDCVPVSMSTFSPETADRINLAKEVDWLVVTTDSTASRQMVYDWNRKGYYLNYIEAAAEGEIGSIAFTPPEFSTAAEKEPGYASVPVWVGPCVSAAMMACAHILHNYIGAANHVYRLGWNDKRRCVTMFTTNTTRRKEAA